MIAYRRALIGLALALAMVMAAAVIGVAAAGAARPSIRSYTVPDAFGPPTVITAGTDANMWVTFDGYGAIGRFTLDGVVKDFSALGPGPTHMLGITAGPDDRVWFTEENGRVEAIDRRGHVQQYPLHIVSGPEGIATGPDGNLWTVAVGNKIGRLTPSGRLRRFAVPGGVSNTGAITAGPDGALWFVVGNAVGRITTSGQVKMFQYRTPGPGVYGLHEVIITGPDGNLWFGNGGQAVRLTPQGQITMFPVVAPSARDASNIAVQALAAGADGNVWFAAADTGNGDGSNDESYGYVTPSGQVFSWVTPALTRGGAGVGNNNNVYGIAPGPDGNLWFAAGAGAVAKVTPYPPRPVTAGTLSVRSGSRSLRGGRVRVNLGCVGAAGLFCQGKVSLVDHGRRTLTRGSPYFAIAALPAPANRQLHLGVALGRSARRRLSRDSVTARVIIKSRTGAVIASQTVTLARRH